MPHMAGTHMPSMGRMTWIRTMARARRVQSPSPTTIPTRILTTSKTWLQTRRRPYLSYLPLDPCAPGKGSGEVTMDLDKGIIVSAHTTTTIMNVGEGEDMGGEGEGEGDAVVPVKGIRYHIAQKITPRHMDVLLHHCRRLRL